MDTHPYFEASCEFCNRRKRGRFSSRTFICEGHSQYEIDFLSSLQDGPLTKDQKAQRRLFMKLWTPDMLIRKLSTETKVEDSIHEKR